jgi:hypothetical protein
MRAVVSWTEPCPQLDRLVRRRVEHQRIAHLEVKNGLERQLLLVEHSPDVHPGRPDLGGEVPFPMLSRPNFSPMNCWSSIFRIGSSVA